MNDFPIYALKTILGLGIFALVYRFIFIEERNFKIRRIYLLLSLFLSFILPLLSFNSLLIFTQTPVNSMIFEEITIYSNGIKNIGTASSVPFNKIFTFTYFAIFSVLFIRILIQIISINIKLRKYKASVYKNVKLIRIPADNTSFSFFRNIFVGKTPGKNDLEKILAHERVHAQQLHTIDVILIELLTVLFWFNPVIWWYKTEIRNVHEYLADEGALNEGFNQKSYQITLLEHLIGSASLSITNNFNYSLIKNRIAMMNKNKQSKKNNWKVFLLIPISLVLVLAFACTKKSDSDTNALKKSSDLEIAYYQVEQMAEFDGGFEGARRFIAQNLKYPDEAAENEVSARIMVTFVVDKNGHITTDFSQFKTDTDQTIREGVVVTKNLESVEKSNIDNNEKYVQLLKDEALRVVKMLPVNKPAMKDGKTVNSIYTFPINFVLQ
jgi:hypothetical protein